MKCPVRSVKVREPNVNQWTGFYNSILPLKYLLNLWSHSNYNFCVILFSEISVKVTIHSLEHIRRKLPFSLIVFAIFRFFSLIKSTTWMVVCLNRSQIHIPAFSGKHPVTIKTVIKDQLPIKLNDFAIKCSISNIWVWCTNVHIYKLLQKTIYFTQNVLLDLVSFVWTVQDRQKDSESERVCHGKWWLESDERISGGTRLWERAHGKSAAAQRETAGNADYCSGGIPCLERRVTPYLASHRHPHPSLPHSET